MRRPAVKTQVVMTTKKKELEKAQIVSDPITGLPVLSAGAGAPVLTSEEVAEMLSEFP